MEKNFYRLLIKENYILWTKTIFISSTFYSYLFIINIFSFFTYLVLCEFKQEKEPGPTPSDFYQKSVLGLTVLDPIPLEF